LEKSLTLLTQAETEDAGEKKTSGKATKICSTVKNVTANINDFVAFLSRNPTKCHLFVSPSTRNNALI
jgi:hypothetical protein